jgi:hypothetical protein
MQASLHETNSLRAVESLGGKHSRHRRTWRCEGKKKKRKKRFLSVHAMNLFSAEYLISTKGQPQREASTCAAATDTCLSFERSRLLL